MLGGGDRVRVKPAAAASAVGTGLLLGPSLVVARVLHNTGFNPERDRRPDPLDLQATAIAPGLVTLRDVSGAPAIPAAAAGHYLLRGARGWGHAGPVLESNGVVAVREFRSGAGDLRPGDRVRLDAFAFESDPLAAHGLPFDDMRFSSPLGEFPAWHVRGESDTWAILTHGKGANRREGLRLMPTLAEHGIHSLTITYRNDEGCPPAPRGTYSYGRDEWEDLEGAVRFALDRGARRIVLAGYSMGGAITLAFMRNSPLAAHASALILDAPMIDLVRTVEHSARKSGVPVRMLPFSNRVAARRYGFDWRDFDHFETACGLDVPVLLFHGDADRTIPVDTSDAFAMARPDIVRYVRIPGADHVRAWNHDPEAYRHTVGEFLREHLRWR
jgi:alpha-beta hydrolase superfamily lysophospholipase